MTETPFNPLVDRISFLETELEETRTFLARVNDMVGKLAEVNLDMNQRILDSAVETERIRVAALMIAEDLFALQDQFYALCHSFTDDGK